MPQKGLFNYIYADQETGSPEHLKITTALLFQNKHTRAALLAGSSQPGSALGRGKGGGDPARLPLLHPRLHPAVRRQKPWEHVGKLLKGCADLQIELGKAQPFE